MVYITTTKAYNFHDLLTADFNAVEHQILVYINLFNLQNVFMRQITAHFDNKLNTSLSDIAVYIRSYGKNLLLTDVQSDNIKDIKQLITIFRDINVCSDIIAFLEYVRCADSDIGEHFFKTLTAEYSSLYDILMYLEEYFVYDKIMERMKKELKYY